MKGPRQLNGHSHSPPRIWAYTRISTDQQSLDRQELEIERYARRNSWRVSRFIGATASSRRTEQQRGIDQLKAGAEANEVSVILFAELSRLGRSVGEIARLIDWFVAKGVTLHFIKECLVLQPGGRDLSTKVILTTFSLLAEIERDLISERTKAGLAARKAAGVRLGRPAGKSKLDAHEATIRTMLGQHIPQRYIARQVGCSEPYLSVFLKRKRPQWEAAGETG